MDGQVYTDAASGRRYVITPNGAARWLDEAPVVVTPPRPRTWMGTTALVMGLLGFVTCGFTALLAVIFGHVGLAESRKYPRREGRENALAGLVLGYVLLAAWVGFWVLGFTNTAFE